MKALCLLLEVSRPGGVAASKPPLRLMLSDAAAVGLMGTHTGCQRCDELMPLDCASQADNPHSPGVASVFSDLQGMTSSFTVQWNSIFLIVFILCCTGGVLCLGGESTKLISYVHTQHQTLYDLGSSC